MTRVWYGNRASFRLWRGAPLFAGMAPALGSRWTLLSALLRRELPGYTDGAARVRWRLAPGLW